MIRSIQQKWSAVSIAIAALMVLALGACEQSAPADSIFSGGVIYTANDASPMVDAVAVRDGVIIYAGTLKGAEAHKGATTQMIDLGGAAMYPGFTDAHGHLYGIGAREMTLNLEGTTSIADMLAKLAARVESTNNGEVVYGRGWIETHWPEGRFPNRDDLDAVSPNNPVILERADGHAIVINSAAMMAVGLTAETAAPFGGEILKDANGRPTGMLIDAAQSLVATLREAPTQSEIEETYRTAGRVYADYGWTGIHSMSVEADNVPVIERLSDADELGLRVYNSIDGFSEETSYGLIKDGPRQSANGHVVTRAIKLYMDGALGSRGAALLEPYSDADSQGLMLVQKDYMMPMLEAALRAGIQVNTHAIGDRGNRELLNWYEEAFNAVPVAERKIAEPRWRDEHTQIVNPDDIIRFRDLGIIPSMQPSHAIGDLHFAPDRLGKDRLVGAYAWKSFIDLGVIVAGGSDAPVERGDPRIEFYAAVARQDQSGFSNEDWHAEEAVSRDQALKMFTLWPAYAAFAEDKLGSIEVGKLADFTVFSRDIMTIPIADVLNVDVVMTVLEGRVVK